MLGMGIQKEAWLKVAEDSKTNGTGLSLEIAKELRDRQKNAFAQITFSEEVEKEMLKNNDHQEAQWCRLIRHWYHAIDEAALSIDQRIEWLLDMREYLLSFLHVGHFPPPGSFVASMTIAQFEGIVGNIDRRLQLFSMTKANSYNQRAITSLDSETFFSAFQDYDPKGSGVLRPDDIPTALGSALCLFNQRISSDRIFHMKTSRKARVYQEHLLSRDTESGEEVHQQNNVDKIDGNGVINARSHPFDLERSKKRKPKRKSGKISSFGMPGRGAQGARQHHRTDEEKILSHKRFGLKDEEVD